MWTKIHSVILLFVLKIKNKSNILILYKFNKTVNNTNKKYL